MAVTSFNVGSMLVASCLMSLSNQSVFHEHHLTHILRCAKNLSELSNRTQSACQAKVYNLYVSWRRQAGQEDILRLRDKQKGKHKVNMM